MLKRVWSSVIAVLALATVYILANTSESDVEGRRGVNVYWYYQDIMLINYKKPSLHQGISRSSFTIPTYRFLSYSSSLLPSFFWYCPDDKISCYKIYLSKLYPRHALHRSRRYIHFLFLFHFQVLFESIASTEIKKYIYIVILSLSITFDLLSYLQNLFYTNTILASHLNAIPPVCFFV